MRKLICDKAIRIAKSKGKIEENFNVRIRLSGREIEIDGKPEDEYIAEMFIQALNFGFPFSTALLIKEEDFMFESINIKSYTKRKDFATIRARLIGKEGGTLRTLTELTKCHFEVKGNEVGIVGDAENIKIANAALISLIHGAKQSNVYSFLEKHHPLPIVDLGLKPVKKKKETEG